MLSFDPTLRTMVYVKAFRGRLLRRLALAFVVLVLGIVVAPVSTVSAWAVNGDPSIAGPAVRDSCSVSFTGTPGVNTGVRELFGVCHMNPNVIGGSFGAWVVHQNRTLAMVTEIRFCSGAAGCSGTPLAAQKVSTQGIGTLTAFSSTLCPGVANCATWRATVNLGGVWNNAPASGANVHMLVFPENAFSSAGLDAQGNGRGCGGFCNGTTGLQPAVYSVSPTAESVPPRYFWTAAWTPPPQSDCSTAALGLSVNGTAVVPGTVAVASYTVSGADDVRVNLTYGASKSPLTLLYRASPAAAFRATEPVSSATILTIKTDVHRLPVTTAQPLSTFEFKCTGTDGISAYFTATGGVWSVTPALNRACASLVVSLPEGTFSEGGTVTIGYNLPTPTLGGFTNNDQWVDVYISIPSTADFPPTVTTKNTFGTTIGGVAPFVGDVPTGTRGTIAFGNVRANTGIDPFLDRPLALVKINCTDSLGTFQIEGTGPSVSFEFTIGDNASCFGGSGMGANPSSWPQGFAKMTVCLVRDFAVPDDAQMAAALTRFEALRDEPPLQWADEGISYVSSSSFSFASWATAGPDCVNFMDTSICPRTFDVAGLIPSWLVGALLFGLWTLVVVAIWRFF